MIAAVLGPISAATESGSMVKSSRMSANRTDAPLRRIALMVAAKVNGVVITSWPGPISSTASAASSASVPLATAIACAVPAISVQSASKRPTMGPCAR